MNRVIYLPLLIMTAGCTTSSDNLKSGSSNVWNLESKAFTDQLNRPAININFNCKVGKDYKVSYRAGSSGSWSTGPIATCTSGKVNYDIKPLVCDTEYEIKVKRKNRPNWDRIVQKADACDSTSNPNANTSNAVRLKQVTTGKCIYGYQTPGTFDTKAYTWACYQNPGMAFTIIVHPTTGKKKLRHQGTSECLTVGNTNGAHAYMTDCHYAKTFILEPVTGNNVRLKAEDINKCLYGQSENGEPVNGWQCWNDPAMNFILEPYQYFINQSCHNKYYRNLLSV